MRKQEDVQMTQHEKYVAYVGTYTHGTSIGIHVYDINIEEGIMTEREVIPVNNASHMAKSYSGRFTSLQTKELRYWRSNRTAVWSRSTKSVLTVCVAATFPQIKMVNSFT